MYSVNDYNICADLKSGEESVKTAISTLYKTKMPVIICVGTNKAAGDCLGPLVGSKLINLLSGKAFVYGTMATPVTAKESETIYKTVRFLHPLSKILVVDAGIGNDDEVGVIKVLNGGIKPGLALNKNLSVLGDVSVVGITAPRKNAAEHLIYKANIAVVYRMSNIIATAIADVIIKNEQP